MIVIFIDLKSYHIESGEGGREGIRNLENIEKLSNNAYCGNQSLFGVKKDWMFT